jgi:hypothetical protein
MGHLRPCFPQRHQLLQISKHTRAIPWSSQTRRDSHSAICSICLLDGSIRQDNVYPRPPPARPEWLNFQAINGLKVHDILIRPIRRSSSVRIESISHNVKHQHPQRLASHKHPKHTNQPNSPSPMQLSRLTPANNPRPLPWAHSSRPTTPSPKTPAEQHRSRSDPRPCATALYPDCRADSNPRT